MKEGWEYKKLGDVAIIINGFAFKSSLFTKEGEKILRISNIQNDIVDLSDVVFFNKETYKQNLDKYKVYPDDILIALSGATTGKIGINKTNETLYLNQRVAICRESVKTLNHKYLYCFLKTKSLEFLKDAEGVAQPNLSTEQMKNYVLPIPPLSEQQHIVEELDLLSSIIEKKKAQLNELDNLAQSLFYEMFGDPISNEKGWKVKKIGEIAESKIGVTYKPTDVNDNGIIVLRSSNIQNSEIDLEDIVRVNCIIKDEKYVRNGDILMCTRNGSFRLVGKVALINNLPERMTYGAFMTIIRSQYNDFLFMFFQLPAFRQQLATAQTATINQITVKMLNDVKVIVPPLDLQNQFASKIEAIEHQKELIKQSIKEVETLFNSRMDYYFN